MTRFFSLLIVVGCLHAQDVHSGRALFRSNCAFCHGVSGLGGRGPSLVTARIAQNTPDASLAAIVHQGIAGTSMPGFDNIEGDDVNQLIAYIRSLSAAGVKSKPLAGNAKHGQQVYAANGCASCHRIGETGSNFGPGLTRIGGARSQEYIRQSIVYPSADIPPDYEGVTVLTAQDKKVTGARINEDTFSVQLRLQNDRFALFKKSDLKSVTHETKSLMPSYDRLPANDLQDLLAYLDTLRGDAAATGDAARAKGVH